MENWTQKTLAVILFAGLLGGCAQQPAPVSVNQPLSGSAVIAGSLGFQGQCGGVNLLLTPAGSTQALYQVPISPNGSFEIHVTPGNYSLVLRGGTCNSQQPVTAIANQVVQVVVYPNGGGGGYPYPNQPYPQPYPNYPCPYGTYGCMGGGYPGTGGGVVGKPNVYVSGPVGTSVHVSVQFKPGNNLLAAIPAHGPQGWKGKLTAQGSIRGERSDDPYFYYDARIDTEKLQAGEAFCVATQEAVPQMASYLRSAGFEAREINDFTDYWQNRLPTAPQLCIYPQKNDVIDQLVELRSRPRPDTVTRVWFFIVPRAQAVSKAPAASAKRWFASRATTPKQVSAPQRSIASANSIHIREWGVGFLVETPGTP